MYVSMFSLVDSIKCYVGTVDGSTVLTASERIEQLNATDCDSGVTQCKNVTTAQGNRKVASFTWFEIH